MIYSKENCKKLIKVAKKIAESEPIVANADSDTGPYDVVRCGERVAELTANLKELFDTIPEWYTRDYQDLYDDSLKAGAPYSKQVDGTAFVAKLERAAAVLLIDIARLRENLEYHPDYQ